MSAPPILACPFCGEIPEVEPSTISGDGPYNILHSEGTCALTGTFISLEQWNRRAPAVQNAAREATESDESMVARVLKESIARVRPMVLAEREGETITGEVMNMILKGSDCPCCYGKGKIPEEAPNTTVAYLVGLERGKHLGHLSPAWIPCSERMPDIGHEVICFTPDRPGCQISGYPVTALMRLLKHEDGPEFYWKARGGTPYYRPDAVTHWMPLPPAPRHQVAEDDK